MRLTSQGQKWMTQVAAETLKRTQDYNRDVIDEIMLNISQYDVGSLTSRGRDSKEQLRYIFFYRDYRDDRDWSKERVERFQRALRFTFAFVEAHNDIFGDHFFVLSPKNVTIYEKHDDERSWTPRNVDSIGVRYAKSTHFGFFKNSRFYLGGVANLISTGFSELVRTSEGPTHSDGV